jgi:hypothetical protein
MNLTSFRQLIPTITMLVTFATATLVAKVELTGTSPCLLHDPPRLTKRSYT